MSVHVSSRVIDERTSEHVGWRCSCGTQWGQPDVSVCPYADECCVGEDSFGFHNATHAEDCPVYAARDESAEDMIRHLFLLANSDPNGPGATDYAFYPAEIRQAARWLVDAVTTEADTALSVLRELVAYWDATHPDCIDLDMDANLHVRLVNQGVDLRRRARALVADHTTDEETT